MTIENGRPSAKGFMKKFEEDGKPGFLVGTEDSSDNYRGPTAVVSWDKEWLHIVTDKYDGHAMLNIESLAPLRWALAEISRRISKAK